MPLQATSGAASYDAFGGGVAAVPNYIEDVFSTYLYKGNGTSQTITNGIDLSTKGGLVWIKDRSNGGSPYEHALTDTARGATNEIQSNSTAAQTSDAARLTSFNSNGFSVGSSARYNSNTASIASWTFRKQPKFFDVVTYTGNGTTQAISHNLGSVPAFIVVKKTNSAEDWWCFHRYDYTQRFKLNATNAAVNTTSVKYLGNNVVDVTPTSTSFTVGDTGGLNGSGDTFVAYLFAHNAGGFGLTGTDNVISCGSYTGTGATLDVNLGYEVQFVLIKPTSVAGNWTLMDNMRGMTPVGVDGTARLRPNTSEAETALGGSYGVFPNATGFTVKSSPGVDDYNASGQTYIYIAIRRGPMKVPTSGTSVFRPNPYRAGLGAAFDRTSSSFPLNDLVITKSVDSTTQKWAWTDRLRGATLELDSAATTAETAYANDITSFAYNNGFRLGSGASGNMNDAAATYEDYMFRRAPNFFDEVCYTGTGSARTISHNLGVAPELMITKQRSGTSQWNIYQANLGASAFVQFTNAAVTTGDSTRWNSTAPTSSVFSLGTSASLNSSGQTYVWYGFATCAGVSKVGSYTGTGTTLQVDCGFTGGARFVLIKRTDSTGDWYVWDSARGIVSGNDPYLLLNSTAAEVTSTDYIDTYSAGFEISSTAPAAINASGGTFIFLAIA